MIKKILLLLIIPSFLFAYTKNDIIVKKEDKGFSLKINLLTPVKINKNFYEYGVNIFLKNFDFNKIYVEKIENFIIKIIPLEKNKTLIKIQGDNTFNKSLLNINSTNDTLTITYGTFAKLENQVKSVITPVKKNENINNTIKPKKQKVETQDDKIIEDITKEVFQKDILPEPATSSKVLPDNKNNKQKEFKIEKTDFISQVIKTYSLLALMIIVLIGIAFLFKRIKAKSFLIKGNKEFFKIIFRQPIAPKKEIAIVKIYDEYLLLGITDYNINLLAKIESENLKNEIRLIEGNRETKKFIKYIKEENEKIESKEKNFDKDVLISNISRRIRNYKDYI